MVNYKDLGLVNTRAMFAKAPQRCVTHEFLPFQ